MKIVPSAANLGELGLQQGQATNFDWKWYFSAAGSLIWLVLIVALLVPKANHNLRVLWILVPLVIVNLAWLVFKSIMGMPSVSASGFGALFQAMVVSTASLWLMAGHLDKLGGVVRFLMCLGILVVAAGLSILSYSMESSREAPLFFALLVLLALAMLSAITLSRRFCGGKYSPVRFMLWLALWILVGSVAAFCLTYVIFILAAVPGSSRPHLSQLILSILMPGVIFAAFLYAINLPFMLLGFAHPFFRERFCACLGLTPVPSGLAAPTAQVGNQP